MSPPLSSPLPSPLLLSLLMLISLLFFFFQEEYRSLAEEHVCNLLLLSPLPSSPLLSPPLTSFHLLSPPLTSPPPPLLLPSSSFMLILFIPHSSSCMLFDSRPLPDEIRRCKYHQERGGERRGGGKKRENRDKREKGRRGEVEKLRSGEGGDKIYELTSITRALSSRIVSTPGHPSITS